MYKRQSIELLGETIYYERIDCFQKEKRPATVLLVHGFNSDSNTFTRFIDFAEVVAENTPDNDELREEYRNFHRFNLYALDLPGCGKSGKNSQITLDLYNKIVVEFINTVLKDHEVILISHSMGSVPCLYAKKECKNVTRLFMVAPLNYALVDDKQKLINLKKWLIPANVEDARNSLKALVYDPEDYYLRNLDYNAEKLASKYNENKETFSYLLNEQILNKDYLLKHVKPLFANPNGCVIIYGENDEFVTPKEIKKIEEDYGYKIVQLNECGHAAFYQKLNTIYWIVQKELNYK